jgi:hypothetical protein
MGQDTLHPRDGTGLLVCSTAAGAGSGSGRLRRIIIGCDDGHGGDADGGPKLRGTDFL